MGKLKQLDDRMAWTLDGAERGAERIAQAWREAERVTAQGRRLRAEIVAGFEEQERRMRALLKAEATPTPETFGAPCRWANDVETRTDGGRDGDAGGHADRRLHDGEDGGAASPVGRQRLDLAERRREIVEPLRSVVVEPGVLATAKGGGTDADA